MKVTSTRPCFINSHLYAAGEVIELPEGMKPSADMTVVDDKVEAKPKAKKAKGDGPTTFSEINKKDAKDNTPKGAEGLV